MDVSAIAGEHAPAEMPVSGKQNEMNGNPGKNGGNSGDGGKGGDGGKEKLL